MTIQKLFCKIMLRSFVLILGLISVTELSANPEFVYSASSLESSVTAPQGGGERQDDRTRPGRDQGGCTGSHRDRQGQYPRCHHG